MRLGKVLLILSMMLSLSGCLFMKKKEEAPAPAAPAAELTSYAVVKVFFGTDRKMSKSKVPSEIFTSARGELLYGTCDVSIPRDHRMGELETPSIWRLEFREDPDKHVVLLDVTPKEKETYFAEIADQLKLSSTDRILVFVHGYNVTFEDAARRTAQMTYDLGFQGAPIFYSWPSEGKLMGYFTDEGNVEWSKTNLKLFINDLLLKTSSKNIYLIAHSMGNRALTRAFGEIIASKPEVKTRFKEIILAAPDIDADVFKNDIAPQITSGQCGITLYASTKDVALEASRKIHGGYKRIGDLNDGVFIASGIDTIDASKVDTSFLGHSYVAERRSILSDIYYLINESKRPPNRFGLERVTTPTGSYWMIKE